MYYVYIIKSINYPDKIYIGYTVHVHERIKKHNEHGSVYTKNWCPWILIFYCSFNDKLKALAFEKYLKSHSGRAFIQKRIV
jgi:predicted GIY-YIG superfamily endonuclease